jgi:hypothetical protein
MHSRNDVGTFFAFSSKDLYLEQSMFLYGSESWIITAVEEKLLEAMET